MPELARLPHGPCAAAAAAPAGEDEDPLAKVEAHLREGGRDLNAFGFGSLAELAVEAVAAARASLAKALSELSMDVALPATLELMDHALVYEDEAGAVAIDPEVLDALEAFGKHRLSFRVTCAGFWKWTGVHGDHDPVPLFRVSLLLFSCLIGDAWAARRLVRMGFAFDRRDQGHALLVADPRLCHEVAGLVHEVEPASSRLKVAENALLQLSTAAAAGERLLCQLPLLTEHATDVIAFAPAWSDANELIKEEIDPSDVRDFCFITKQVAKHAHARGVTSVCWTVEAQRFLGSEHKVSSPGFLLAIPGWGWASFQILLYAYNARQVLTFEQALGQGRVELKCLDPLPAKFGSIAYNMKVGEQMRGWVVHDFSRVMQRSERRLDFTAMADSSTRILTVEVAFAPVAVA